MNHASIEGQISKVERRGKSLYCFEGVGLHKAGAGDAVQIDIDATRYVGELVAIGPTRAIVFISPCNAAHRILYAPSTVIPATVLA